MSKGKIPKLVKDDPWLEPYQDEISDRIVRFKRRLEDIKSSSGSLMKLKIGYAVK